MDKEPRDIVVSLDIEEKELSYRVLRGKNVVYVLLTPGDFIPRSDRTDGSRVLKVLKTLDAWQDRHWTTLTAAKLPSGEIISQKDTFTPHAVEDATAIDATLPKYDFADVLAFKDERLKSSVFTVTGMPSVPTAVCKIAPFYWDVGALTTELRFYRASRNLSLHFVPRFLGYVYENTPSRIVGFLMEHVEGRPPCLGDEQICREAIRLLHACGFIHGDLRRSNMIVRDTGPVVLIDFDTVRQMCEAPPGEAEREANSVISVLEEEDE